MRSRRGSRRGDNGVGGPAAAARSAELVLPGQPDLERLQADPRARTTTIRAIQPTVKKWRVALILVDYPDRPFTVTQAAGSNIFGNPSALAHSVPRDQVPQFYADFLNKPTALNNFQTMNRYWMENSFGRYGVELVPYGPYRMPAKSYQYHIQNFQNVTADCPNPTRATPNPEPCGLNFFNAARGAWEAAVPAAERATFDNMFWTSAGQDESGAWQEFGEMRFANQDAVTDPFGPKAIDPLHPRGNWASTRYIPWTSWAAAANVWPSASGTSSTEAESAGMAVYAHELSHNLGIPDNYNNPYTRAVPADRGRHVGHDEPRLVQRSRRPAHALADPADPGRRAGRAAQPAQQALPELHRRQRHPAPEPRRPGPERPRRGGGQGA